MTYLVGLVYPMSRGGKLIIIRQGKVGLPSSRQKEVPYIPTSIKDHGPPNHIKIRLQFYEGNIVQSKNIMSQIKYQYEKTLEVGSVCPFSRNLLKDLLSS